MPEFRPVPQTSGSLEPPNRFPPTAVGAATPEPEPRPRQSWYYSTRRRPSLVAQLLRLTVGTAFALADIAADALRGTAGSGRR